MQVATGSLCALHVVLVGARNGGDLRQVAGDVFSHGGLFFGGGGDLAVHVSNRLHCNGDALQRLPRMGDLLDTFFAAGLTAFDGVYRVVRTCLHRLDDLIDLGRGRCRALCQGAYLIGDDAGWPAGSGWLAPTAPVVRIAPSSSHDPPAACRAAERLSSPEPGS